MISREDMGQLQRSNTAFSVTNLVNPYFLKVTLIFTVYPNKIRFQIVPLKILSKFSALNNLPGTH